MKQMLIAVALIAAVIGTMGCARSAPSRLPETEIAWPTLELTLSWNGGRYAVPAPAVIPAERLEADLRKWDRHRSAKWPVQLPDGRTAVVLATRDASGAVSIDRADVHRADGSLELEQWNIDGRPNAPGYWIIYAPDGHTKEVAVSATHGYVNEIVFHENGIPARRYLVSRNAIVQAEDRILPDGAVSAMNIRPGLR